MNANDSALSAAAKMIEAARSIVVMTGAGVSAESGLATFRDPEEGLWAKYDPMDLAHIDAFERDPELVTRWYHHRFVRARDVDPNPGHRALAALQQHTLARGAGFTLLTQNVDGLHQRGGSPDVVELHGTIVTWRCTHTGTRLPLDEVDFAGFPIPSPFSDEPGALMRPCVVWFGEALPQDALERSFEAVDACDLFISIGTSAVVEPAASFIRLAQGRGAKTVEINRDATPNTAIVDVALHGPSGVVLPRMIERLGIAMPRLQPE